ncbi:fibronectin type III domain-containing protein [Micromonospora sp. NPDC000668]|uniref:fibronectin type III domain-containing protein n=1 Tax=Micromonospora sp. NPDC000668 TaxID=3364219 RepID=UPI0036C69609
MVDVSIEDTTSSSFTFGPPPPGVTNWSASWTTSMRPPHLGPVQVCSRAEREPGRYAKILRDITVVDLIPPSNVPNLAVGTITATSAKVSWGAATDNDGLAGYEVTVDGGTTQRTTIGTRSYSITGLQPLSNHTVSVVAIDLAGNRSATPATTSFTTDALPPPPDVDAGLILDPDGGRHGQLAPAARQRGELPRLPGRRDLRPVRAGAALRGRQRPSGQPVHGGQRH